MFGADVLRAHGYAAAVKWPNDVLLPLGTGERPAWGKVAGILLERVETPRGPAAVVGIVLNLMVWMLVVRPVTQLSALADRVSAGLRKALA